MTKDDQTSAPSGRDTISDVGLVGGSIERRVAEAKVPPIVHPAVLAPFRRPDDAAPFEAFLNKRPLHVEIGFGRPHFLVDLAKAKPEAHVLGFETQRRWVHKAALAATRHGLTNLRAVEGDARPYFERCIAPGSVEAVYILFPDPWWKKKHHKRRLFQPAFLACIRDRLVPGGYLVARTDVDAYADLMVEQIDALNDESGPGQQLALVASSIDDPILSGLPQTHREKKCAQLDVFVFHLRYERTEE
ncbi:MAG: tRNA (guanine-N7-)-methyltransferase [Myxococcota bacterium]